MACACNGKGGTQTYSVTLDDGSVRTGLNKATAEVLRARKGRLRGKITPEPIAKRK